MNLDHGTIMVYACCGGDHGYYRVYPDRCAVTWCTSAKFTLVSISVEVYREYFDEDPLTGGPLLLTAASHAAVTPHG